jgi:uncharacterized membrane protein YheB (UPF0754 family)
MSGLVKDLTEHWYIYAAMPVVAAVIGYVTKLVAVEMMFRPLEFRGIPPVLGWQGIIPRNAERMGQVAIDTMMDRLLSPQELIDRIDIKDMQNKLHEPLMAIVDEMTREIMAKYQPFVWESLPEPARKLMIWNVRRRVPAALEHLMGELRENVESVIDVRAMAVDALVRDKATLVRFVRTIGRKEMRFIVSVGLPFGFAMGLVQAGAWALTHNSWIMPTFGGITGLVTDYLALQMVFRPIEPTRYLGFIPWQGMFHKRRAEVTEDYSRLIAAEIMTPANVLDALLTGPQSEQFLGLISREIQQVVDAQSSIARPLVVASVGGRQYQELKADAVQHVLDVFHARPEELTEYASHAFNVPDLIRTKMALMTNDEYEGLLRPAFKQDEWKLVTVGALLGFLIGELQVHLLLT